MIAECKTHLVGVLADAGLAEVDIGSEPSFGTRHRSLPRAWLDLQTEVLERRKKRVGRFESRGSAYWRWQTHDRQFTVLVRIEHKTLGDLEGVYEEFLRNLGVGLYDAGDNFIRIGHGRVEWYEPEGVTGNSAGVAVPLTFDGAVYYDELIETFDQVEVEPGELLE